MRRLGTPEDTERVRQWQELVRSRVIALALKTDDHEISVSDVREEVRAGRLPAPPEVSDSQANQFAAFSNLLRNLGFHPTSKLVKSTSPSARGRKVRKWYLPLEEYVLGREEERLEVLGEPMADIWEECSNDRV